MSYDLKITIFSGKCYLQKLKKLADFRTALSPWAIPSILSTVVFALFLKHEFQQGIVHLTRILMFLASFRLPGTTNQSWSSS